MMILVVFWSQGFSKERKKEERNEEKKLAKRII